MVPMDPAVRSRPWAAVGGIAGPAGFVAAWSWLGARANDYSPIDDPISRLAAVGAPTAPAMTGGFLAFAGGVLLYASASRVQLSGATAAAAATTALATAAVAAMPLEGRFGTTGHAIGAGVAYASLAALPILAARPLRAHGHGRAATASRVLGVASAACLTASVVLPSHTGLFQRAGLTLGDLWIVASSTAMLRAGRGATS